MRHPLRIIVGKKTAAIAIEPVSKSADARQALASRSRVMGPPENTTGTSRRRATQVVAAVKPPDARVATNNVSVRRVGSCTIRLDDPEDLSATRTPRRMAGPYCSAVKSAPAACGVPQIRGASTIVVTNGQEVRKNIQAEASRDPGSAA